MTKTALQDITVRPDAPIRDALDRIEGGAPWISVVTEADGQLLGTVTDGDIRRAILRGVTLDDNAGAIMNRHPVKCRQPVTWPAARELMDCQRVRQLMVVDEDDRLAGVVASDGTVLGLDLRPPLQTPEAQSDIPVLILAGGLGSRLRPLTEDTPKPLLTVGDRPLLETIVATLAAQGFYRIFLSVNYKAEMFEEHFGDGADLGVEIHYIQEEDRLGTAGPLGLLPDLPSTPVLVLNGDVLTDVDFRNMVDFHREEGGIVTMAVREYCLHVPYGVAELDGHRISGLLEKPKHTFFINAGMYVLEPSVLTYVETNSFLDMTDLIDAVLVSGESVNAFPVREYWLDIGRIEDYEQAQQDIGWLSARACCSSP